MTDASPFYDAMANRQRRRILLSLYLRDDGSEISVDPDSDVFRDEGSSLAVRLNHVHLPKLESYGFIEWDCDRMVATRGEGFESICPALSLVRDSALQCP